MGSHRLRPLWNKGNSTPPFTLLPPLPCGLWSCAPLGPPLPPRQSSMPGPGREGTCSFSMGRVTLYRSKVLTMMAGVVRKKKRKKRKVLIVMKRAHQ